MSTTPADANTPDETELPYSFGRSIDLETPISVRNVEQFVPNVPVKIIDLETAPETDTADGTP